VGFLEERANLAGKVAVLVGGGGGLGRACALDLGRAGVRVALADRDESALRATVADVEAAGGETLAAVFDAREPEELAAFYEQVDETWGDRLDVLVNVVGGTFAQPFEESNPRGWDALIRTNFVWLLHSTQLAIPRLRREGGGSIINLTSIEAHRAAPRYAVYAAMKAAVHSLTRSLAVELAPDAIRVNTIATDLVPTGAMAELQVVDDDKAQLHHQMMIPMGRCGTYEDVGGCALFLASDLSSYVTGSSLHPDGGAIASSGWMNWPDYGFLNHPSPPVIDWLLRPEG
jgi:3-oxoacyl-[acyl-carrier protein] reductase